MGLVGTGLARGMSVCALAIVIATGCASPGVQKDEVPLPLGIRGYVLYGYVGGGRERFTLVADAGRTLGFDELDAGGPQIREAGWVRIPVLGEAAAKRLVARVPAGASVVVAGPVGAAGVDQRTIPDGVQNAPSHVLKRLQEEAWIRPEKASRCFDGECHRPLALRLATTKLRHAPVKETSCKPCHQPHGNARPDRRTPDQIKALCIGCHAEIGKIIRGSSFRHTPIDKPGCTACHAPHGSDTPDLLDYPPPSPEPGFDPPLNSFCTKSCHKREWYRDAANAKSAFRDGARNLHARHTAEKKGRGCNSCHDTHASSQPFHIRPDVPFGTGGWKLPISFTRTEQGGLCVIGCHKPKSYAREKPGVRPEAGGQD